MRRGGDELLARLLELLELALHLVEGNRQLPQLIVGVDLYRVVEVAGRHLLGRELQALDALAQRPRDEVAADQRQQQRDPAGDEDLVPHDLDAVHDVRDGVGVDDHRADPALVVDGVGGLRNGPVARRLDARLGRARHRRLAGDAERQRGGGRELARVGLG